MQTDSDQSKYIRNLNAEGEQVLYTFLDPHFRSRESAIAYANLRIRSSIKESGLNLNSLAGLCWEDANEIQQSLEGKIKWTRQRFLDVCTVLGLDTDDVLPYDSTIPLEKWEEEYQRLGGSKSLEGEPSLKKVSLQLSLEKVFFDGKLEE